VIHEMLVDHLYLRLDGRVFEALSDHTGHSQRVHVDVLGVVVKGPDGDGRYRVRIGIKDGEEVLRNAARVDVQLDEAEFRRFERFTAAVRAARDGGPDRW
jgi:hypothetical protein